MGYVVKQLYTGRQYREYDQNTPYEQWLEEILEFWPKIILEDSYSPSFEYTVAYYETKDVGIFAINSRWFFIN